MQTPPDLHLEFAQQRRRELVARAERHHIASARRDADPPRSDALGAFVYGEDHLVGFAHYAEGDRGRGPEPAVAVGDAWRRQGVGTELDRTMIARSRAAGHVRLHVHVLADTGGALSFLQQLGFGSVGREGPLVVLGARGASR